MRRFALLKTRPEKPVVPPSPLDLAASVLLESNREHPADSVLREQVKRRRIPVEIAREAARLVYSYYRWKGWTEPKGLIRKHILRAEELANGFASHPESFPDADLLARVFPPWIADWVDVSPAWARALQKEPHLWLRAKRGQASFLESSLGAARASSLPDTLAYSGTTDLFSTPEYTQGLFEVQDISSQAVSLICAPKAGETWWDACAGEGGKTLHLSDLMANKGLIWASDRAEWRLRKLKTRAGRAGAFNYRSAVWDGSAKLPTKTKFDGILVDAPCSGIGTWQRNPHARWTLKAKDIQELAALQKQLLAHAIPSMKPGGRLIYSVCTVSRAETTEVAQWVEETFPELEPRVSPNPLAPDEPPAARHWLWPQQCGGNGMFVACWTKRTSAKA